ncbi:hypothetical protein Tco_1535506 [Tanacetum coccineum]
MLALHTPKRRSTTDQFIFQTRTPATEEVSTRPSTQPQDDTSANIVRDSPSSVDAEIGEDVDKLKNIEEKTIELDQDQDGSDPGETHESQPLPEQVLMDEDQAGPDPGISHVALVGLDPEPMHDEFMADLYPKVQESFSLMTKSTDDEPGKLNVEAEVVSMFIILIYQASSSVPPLSTPVIDLSPPIPVSSTTQAPIFTTITSNTTTTRPPPHPPQQQSIIDSELVACVTALEQKFATFEQKSKNLDNITQNLGSRVFTLELRDLPHKIDEAIRENVKEAVQISLQAPLRERFRHLPEADMKEMFHQRMFETGSYKSLPEHITLYEALEASMERA